MNARRSMARRVGLAMAMALVCAAALETQASATAAGANTGEIAGTFTYAQVPPLAPACSPNTWTISASGAAVAAQVSVDTSSGGLDSFGFAGTTTISGSGVAACANGAEDLLGTLSLSVVSTGSGGALSCSGSGDYVRVAVGFFAELGMSCTYGSRSLGSSLVTLTGTLVPTSAALSQFAFQGTYMFDLSSVSP